MSLKQLQDLEEKIHNAKILALCLDDIRDLNTMKTDSEKKNLQKAIEWAESEISRAMDIFLTLQKKLLVEKSDSENILAKFQN